MATKKRVIPTPHRTQEFLTRHRHVVGILSADAVVTLVGAGAAACAGVHEYCQRAVAVDQLAKPRDGNLLPVIDQLPGIAERLAGTRFSNQRDNGIRALHGARELSVGANKIPGACSSFPKGNNTIKAMTANRCSHRTKLPARGNTSNCKAERKKRPTA